MATRERATNEEVTRKVYEVMLEHLGIANAISASKIAGVVWPKGAAPSDAPREIRAYIRKVMETYRIAIASSGRGYYVITTKGELRRYVKGLGDQIKELKARAQLVWDVYHGMDVEFKADGKGND